MGNILQKLSAAGWTEALVDTQIPAQVPAIEAQDLLGIAYWFIGVQGKLLTIMGVLSAEFTAQSVFKELSPIALGRMAGP